ncbi:MAG: hypothetical protein OIF48_03305 [Silicimonas sp.]|nr:hypothetical protein [Silicimonas sp.]
MPCRFPFAITTLTLAGLGLSACAGMTSPEQAARICEERARNAAGPTGKASIRVNNRGETRAGLKLKVTSDFLKGRDPYQVYDECVRRKSGQGPIRPLILEDT